MLEVWGYMIPIGLLILCVYTLGSMSGYEKAKNIYNPVLRKNDIK